MRRIEKRTWVCLVLVGILVAGLALFVFKFFTQGSTWASQAYNRHLYNDDAKLTVGVVLDRDGDRLTWIDEDGDRQYYDDVNVRKSTLHVVGDASGNIGSGALTAFADKLTGYNFITGAGVTGNGNYVTLTIDARYNYTAYQALNGHKGVVAVYNYKTGEILCDVSSPCYDPMNEPTDILSNPEYNGAYINMLYGGLFAPGSVFKTLTLNAALNEISDIKTRVWTCDGSIQIGDDVLVCERSHGEQNVEQAFANSCNCVFGLIADELGPDVLRKYVDLSGLTDQYSINGIATERSSFDFEKESRNQMAWSGIGQGHDMVNPCAMMIYMGAIANGGKAAVPQIVKSVSSSTGFPMSFYLKKMTGELVAPSTAKDLQKYMINNVEVMYGTSRFPNMIIGAKSGTAEVTIGEEPNSLFAGFVQNKETPLAFFVLVENGGSGAGMAANVASAVLDEIVNGY